MKVIIVIGRFFVIRLISYKIASQTEWSNTQKYFALYPKAVFERSQRLQLANLNTSFSSDIAIPAWETKLPWHGAELTDVINKHGQGDNADIVIHDNPLYEFSNIYYIDCVRHIKHWLDILMWWKQF